MPPPSVSQIAQLAGVDSGYVERLVDLGVVEPDDDGNLPEVAARRVRIVEGLEEAGLPLAALGEALRAGIISIDYTEYPAYERWASLSDVTFEEMSRETGVPLEVLTVIREAMGFARPRPSDRLRKDELDVVALVQIQHRHGFRDGTIQGALRVSGDGMRRIAETESDWWRDDLAHWIMDSGVPAEEVLEESAKLAPALIEAGDRAMLAIYHGQQTNAWLRKLLEGYEIALETAGLYQPPERVPAMCFLDLTGYTRVTEERGDEAAADLARDLSTSVQQHALRYGGTAVKWLGDGVMFHFPDPENGVLAALDMVEAAAGLGLPPAHVGLHAGPVLVQEGDYFGRTVNTASRIADYARPGEVVVSREVVEATGTDAVTFTEIGAVELEGISGEVHLYEAARPAP